ncbi:MAG: DUF402 domain-containing protein [Acidimicrobiia bacterium]|nr:DUF402 domain-containing protein [Acidimicrobiia bacterium]
MDGAGRNDRIWVVRSKWPDRPWSRALAHVLGTDEHGTWVGLPGGHTVHRGDTVVETAPFPVVMCIPLDGWWVANWYGRSVELMVDVVAPPRWGDDAVTLVGLDFRVMVHDGEARLVDAERFEEQRLLYEYPSTIESGARRAAAEVLATVSAGVAPFTLDLAVGWFSILRAVADGAMGDGGSTV